MAVMEEEVREKRAFLVSEMENLGLRTFSGTSGKVTVSIRETFIPKESPETIKESIPEAVETIPEEERVVSTARLREIRAHMVVTSGDSEVFDGLFDIKTTPFARVTEIKEKEENTNKAPEESSEPPVKEKKTKKSKTKEGTTVSW